MFMKKLFKLLIIIIFIPTMAACVLSGFTEGIASFKAQDFRTAFIRLKPEADKGQPDAQYAVGYMYYYGTGVVEDRKKAWFYINRAAVAGQPEALVAVKILGCDITSTVATHCGVDTVVVRNEL